ncbi:MAG: hypothetical protein ACOX83_08280 [Candidatus Spyradocola sp.]|jgi:hypothetical protein
MVRPLFQAEEVGQVHPPFPALLPDGQPGRAVPLPLHQAQKIVQLLLPHGLFQVFQDGQAVSLQRVLGAGGGEGDGDAFVPLPDAPHRLHAARTAKENRAFPGEPFRNPLDAEAAREKVS